MRTQSEPLVSIVMPALNEEDYVSAAIDSIVPQPHELNYELIVVDGGSTDRTRAIVEAIASRNERVRIISNERRLQAAGVNLGARMAHPEARYFIRADCHLRYPENFVARCIATLEEKAVASVVVPMHAEGRACTQKAVAAAQNSRLGNGGSAHRLRGRSGYVEHGHHAAFNREVFLELGGYDESFSHNEDAEFDRRLTSSGRRIFLDGETVVTYYPRSNFCALARQYFSHGQGRARTLLKHAALPRARQMLPVIALGAILASAALSGADLRYLALPAAYVLGCAIWGLGLALHQRQICVASSGVAAMIMHMSWAAGFLLKLVLGSAFDRLPFGRSFAPAACPAPMMERGRACAQGDKVAAPRA